MSFNTIQADVAQYYSLKLKEHGATARGTDWNSSESQELRFQQILKICSTGSRFSINDYGCGYGALAGYMVNRNYDFQYQGFDICPDMIAQAAKLYEGLENCKFFADESFLNVAEYTVASGIFNVKLEASSEEWQKYVLHILRRMAKLSDKGFAFNVLTNYSDPDRMRPDLFYADPLFLFDYCKRHFSKFVSLLHDYPLYECTILVRHG